jgi:hypothetical protein
MQKVPTRHALAEQELKDWLASKGLTESSRQFYVVRYLPDFERCFNPFTGSTKSLPRGSVKPVPAERQLEDALFAFLEERGFRPRRQVRTKQGIADVVLENAILELKHELTPGCSGFCCRAAVAISCPPWLCAVNYRVLKVGYIPGSQEHG